jgi:hypothetical protein
MDARREAGVIAITLPRRETRASEGPRLPKAEILACDKVRALCTVADLSRSDRQFLRRR